MTGSSIIKKAGIFRKKFLTYKKPLIIISKPIDPDCIGSALSLSWWFSEVSPLKADVVSFFYLGDSLIKMPCRNKVKFIPIEQFIFNHYDLFILIDGGDWKQFFKDDFQKYLSKIDKKHLFHIDHHQEGVITSALGENSLRILDSCVGKIIYDYFIKPSNLKLTDGIATCLYMSLIGDTGNFRYQMYKETYSFAKILYENGANHNIATESSFNKQIIDYTQWAIKNTKYYPKAQSTILILDKENQTIFWEIFGRDEEIPNNIDYYYKSTFMSVVEGFPYSLVFELSKKVGIKVSWRTKTASPIEIKEILSLIGFEAGGHRDAGGGNIKESNIQKIVTVFLNKMEETLQNQ